MPSRGLSDESQVEFRSGAKVLLSEEETDVVGEEGAQIGEGELQTLKDVAFGVFEGEGDGTGGTA